jgi:hypothetical protein
MVILVSGLKVLQIVRMASCWVCSKQNVGQFVSSLIEINFHARISARLDETGSIRKYRETLVFDTRSFEQFSSSRFLASKRSVSKNPPKFVVLEVLILLDEDV